MTRKQFEWLRCNQPIEVRYFELYKGKEPKDYHHIYHNIRMEFNGEYIIFTGTYHNWNGGKFGEHYGRYKIHYKNVRSIIYNRSRRTR